MRQHSLQVLIKKRYFLYLSNEKYFHCNLTFLLVTNKLMFYNALKNMRLARVLAAFPET